MPQEADDPRTLRRADFPVIREVQTRWADQDVFGHVNNAIHYVLMDSAICGWLLENSTVDIRKTTSLCVVAETGCRYLAEINFPQRLDIGIALEHSGRSSVRYSVAFFGDDQSPAAVARFVHVYVDRETRQPVPIPPEIQQVLEILR